MQYERFQDESWLRSLDHQELVAAMRELQEHTGTRHRRALDLFKRISIERIDVHVKSEFARRGLDDLHGPEHWGRVAHHATLAAHSMRANPLVPEVFALVHDSQRVNDGDDPMHGPRAADWILAHRDGLFAFLDDSQIEDLTYASRHHSAGMISAPGVVAACWDADRLDLWRVGIEPLPRFLTSAYAKNPQTVDIAYDMWRGIEQSESMSYPHH